MSLKSKWKSMGLRKSAGSKRRRPASSLPRILRSSTSPSNKTAYHGLW